MGARVVGISAEAELVLAAVLQQFSGYLADYSRPRLVSLDARHMEYLIVWENGSPYGWPQLISAGGINEELANEASDFNIPASSFMVEPVSVPGVMVEPIDGITLGIYAD